LPKQKEFTALRRQIQSARAGLAELRGHEQSGDGVFNYALNPCRSDWVGFVNDLRWWSSS